MRVWDVRRRLGPGSTIRLIQLPRTGSTNDIARRAAARGLPQGLVVVADEQLAGRGQAGRRWDAPAGANLLLSLLLRPPLAADRSYLLSALAAVAVVEAIAHEAGVAAALKWPNDVLVGDRKICGILVEIGTIGDRLVEAILGVGLNVGWHPPDDPGGEAMPATSLVAEAGRPIDRAALLATLLGRLEDGYRRLAAGGAPELRATWRGRLREIGRRVVVADKSSTWRGRALDTREDGALVVADESGARRALAAGRVRVRLAD